MDIVSFAQQFLSSIDPRILTGITTGIVLGAVVGLILWPLLKEPDLTGRIFLGGAFGAVLGAAYQSILLGRTVGYGLRQAFNSALTPDATQFTPQFLSLLSFILVAMLVGAAAVATIMSASRAILGVLIGFGVGAISGLMIALIFMSWNLAVGSLFFQASVVLGAIAIFALGFGKQ